MIPSSLNWLLYKPQALNTKSIDRDDQTLIELWYGHIYQYCVNVNKSM